MFSKMISRLDWHYIQREHTVKAYRNNSKVLTEAFLAGLSWQDIDCNVDCHPTQCCLCKFPQKLPKATLLLNSEGLLQLLCKGQSVDRPANIQMLWQRDYKGWSFGITWLLMLGNNQKLRRIRVWKATSQWDPWNILPVPHATISLTNWGEILRIFSITYSIRNSSRADIIAIDPNNEKILIKAQIQVFPRDELWCPANWLIAFELCQSGQRSSVCWYRWKRVLEQKLCFWPGQVKVIGGWKRLWVRNLLGSSKLKSVFWRNL